MRLKLISQEVLVWCPELDKRFNICGWHHTNA